VKKSARPVRQPGRTRQMAWRGALVVGILASAPDAIYDQQLRSRFDWLREPDPDAVATPPMFMVFDLLHQDGREFTGRPLRDRRARLENAIAGSDLVLPVRRLASNGFEAWAEVIAHDFEGLEPRKRRACMRRGRRGGG